MGQVSRGLGARPPRGLGPFPHKTTQTSQITIFRKPPGGSLAKAWVSAETAASEVGTWRETKPGYPPYPVWGRAPSPPSATIQHAPQGRRIGVIIRILVLRPLKGGDLRVYILIRCPVHPSLQVEASGKGSADLPRARGLRGGKS